MTGVRIPGFGMAVLLQNNPSGRFFYAVLGWLKIVQFVTICCNIIVDRGAGIWDNTLLNWAESMRRNDRKTRRMVLCSCSEFEIIAL